MMPAVRWFDRGDVHLAEVAEPEPPGPGMVLVGVRYCGLCGTDVSEYRSGPVMIQRSAHPLTGQAPPITLGHELVGEVVAVGEGVAESTLGQRVTADACWRCGRCAYCLRGDYHICVLGGALGLHSDGALAPFVRMPAYMVVPIPSEVSDESAALAEPAAVALHAVDRGGIEPGHSVVVVGFGPVGCIVAKAAQLAGAGVAILEASGGRRSRANSLGFDPVLEAEPESARQQVKSWTGGLGADVVIDCTGKAAATPGALELVRRGGTLVLTGVALGPTSLETNRIVFFERQVVGSLGYRNDLPRVLDLAAEGRLDLASLVSDVVPLQDAVRHGLDALADEADAHFKVLVRCSG